MTHVFLLGFPGTGTVTIGKQLAERLSLPFCDADARIEKSLGKDLLAIYRELGREAFAQTAQQNLKEIAEEGSSVVALADHIPFTEKDWAILEKGQTVYIQRPAERLVWRLRYDRKLPVFEGVAPDERDSFIESQLVEREPFYKRAQIVLPCYHEEVPDIARLIEENLAAL
ncbi:MAG: hypothetical protein H6728_04520 [Myxococcales bacterium]|nr:hypothetical protein [Myxococcales bacterium]MCB9642317.1 hypothetical protein [Myxococcales bacterium]